ncbi:sugar phosphate isomerase/epimerase family protein [Collinsella aerofaciens]|nr:sugar phosphate isomerase/epimerase family protein [Collinsella aerofaciens]
MRGVYGSDSYAASKRRLRTCKKKMVNNRMKERMEEWIAPSLTAMNCHHRFFTLEEFFSSSARIGFGGVEIWTSPQHFYMDYSQNESVDKLRRLEDRYHIKVVGICPEQTNPKPNNIAVNGQAAQKRVFSYFKRAIDVARAIGAKQVVVTSGWAFLDECPDEAYSRSIRMMRRIAEYAGEQQVMLAIEALQPRESLLVNSADDLKRYVDEVACPALGVCLDTGAMTRAGDTIEDYFTILGKSVIHAHFVDVDCSQMVTHLSWGDGTRDMSEDVADFINYGYKGSLSVEATSRSYFTHPYEADERSMALYRQALGRYDAMDRI